MPAKAITISLKSDGRVLASIDMVRGCEPICVGRSHACQLRAPADESSVSGRHARLFWKGSSLFIEDAGSRNGVFMDGRRIKKPVKVTPGGIYAIGNCQIVASTGDCVRSRAATRHHQLMFLNGDRANQLVDIAPKGDSGEFLIGLDPSCDICLTDMLVSRKHAKLNIKAGGECWISDEGSRNGTYVNGEKLGVKERLLKDGDKISIAYFDLRFLDRSVKHSNVNVAARLAVMAVTMLVLGGAWLVYQFNPNRRTAGDYRSLASKAAAAERFDLALTYMDGAETARNASDESIQNNTLRGQIRQWKAVSEQWAEVMDLFAKGRLREARIKLSGLPGEAYAWAWNDTTARDMRRDADFAANAIRVNTDAAEHLERTVESVVERVAIEARISALDAYLAKNADGFKARPYMEAVAKSIRTLRDRFDSIRAGIERIDGALDSIAAETPDFEAVIRVFEQVAGDSSLPQGVRNYAESFMPVCRSFIETQNFLEREKATIADMDFQAVISCASSMPLPDRDACARQSRLSDARDALAQKHEENLQVVRVLNPMIRNLETAGIRNGERGRLLTFVTSPASWDAALAFDCFSARFPLPSRIDPTGVYDELVGIEYTYENLRELPKPPGRKTAVLMNFIPKCQTAKMAFEQVSTFIAFMDRSDNGQFKVGRLGRLYALAAQILADKAKLVSDLKKRSQGPANAWNRARIVAGYYAEYFADKPSYADLRALEMAFRSLQKQVNAMNEQYEAESDPERRLRMRQQMLETGIPGMEAVRARWVEAEE